jgi:DNA-directed RNA polymerase subunit beta'
MEARMLMLAPNNIFSPSSGKPITTPSQDIPLGCYYLTQNPRGEKGDQRLPLFADPSEVELAISEGAIGTHSRIRFKNPNFGVNTIFGSKEAKILETTAGRVVFNEIWPVELGFYNKVCGKKQLSDIIWRCYKAVGQQRTVETLDRLKMGFRSATKAGISIGITDMIIPREKSTQLDKAYREIAEVEKQYRRGIITDGERKNKVQDIWTHTGEELANALFRTLEYNDGSKDMNRIHDIDPRPRQRTPGEAARRYARSTVIRRNHERRSFEFQRRALSARVFHLDARARKGLALQP